MLRKSIGEGNQGLSYRYAELVWDKRDKGTHTSFETRLKGGSGRGSLIAEVEGKKCSRT